MTNSEKRTPEENKVSLGHGGGIEGDIEKVPFSEDTRKGVSVIFNDAFMQEYTNCKSFDEFMFSSAVFINWDSDLLVYSKSQFDMFVSEVSVFSTWDEMLKKAGEVYIAD
jgi:hypothetical protein